MSIDLNLNSEQQQIVSGLRSMLTGRFPVARFHQADARKGSGALLRAVAEFGAFGLWLPEDRGGAGMSVVEEVLVHLEFGRFLVTPSALAAALAGRLAHECGLSDLSEAIASGAVPVCLANALRSANDGADLMVFDSEGCGHALLWRGADMLLLDTEKLGLTPARSMDHSVTLAHGHIGDGAILGRVTAATSRLTAIASLLVSAQLVGMAQATRDLASDYAKIRTQFGAPIGSFQAVKHRCADMAIRTHALEAQLNFAAIAERDGWQDAEFQQTTCRMLANRYTLENAASNIQIHGGIGFSSETDAHLYVLRAHLLENVGERPWQIEDRFMQQAAPTVA